MNHAAQHSDQARHLPQPSLAELSSMALWGICFSTKKQIIATHRDLAILRRCAKLVMSNPGQVVHVITPAQTQHAHYIATTLMHLGVSCGQIQLRSTTYDSDIPESIWLLIANPI